MNGVSFSVSEAELMDTPSRRDGIDAERELRLRVYGCELLQQAGILLKMPQVCMATGQVLFQRFFFKCSFASVNVKAASAAALFLGAKLEEAPHRIVDIVEAYHHLDEARCGRPPTPFVAAGLAYQTLSDLVARYEMLILRACGFHVRVVHAHKVLLVYLFVLQASDALRQMAWNIANDSLRSPIVVRYQPEVVAVACIVLAARKCGTPLPASMPWWEVFEVPRCDVLRAAVEIAKLYTLPPATYVEAYTIGAGEIVPPAPFGHSTMRPVYGAAPRAASSAGAGTATGPGSRSRATPPSVGEREASALSGVDARDALRQQIAAAAAQARAAADALPPLGASLAPDVVTSSKRERDSTPPASASQRSRW